MRFGVYLLIVVAVQGIGPVVTIGQEEPIRRQDHAKIDGAESAEPRTRIPTETSITMFTKRVEKNPRDYQSLTVLGRLYLRHAKESDDLAAYGKSEETLRKALEIKPDFLAAKTYLATVLQARHQFAAALELAEQVVSAKPSDTLALATVGDSQLELGRYDDAEQSYIKLAARQKSPSIAVRLAHLAELKGDSDKAIKLTQAALQDVIESGRSSSDIAWYEFRIASLLEGEGRVEDAEKHYLAALQLLPSYAPVMSGLARLHALQGRYEEAIKLYDQAIAEHGEPPMMAALGDVYAKLGKHDRANQLYDQADAAMVEEAKHAADAHLREVALFYCDHDRKLPRALELAQSDMSLRQDIYAHDTLAWALHKNGQHDKALDAINQALKLGTRDAKLHFHAGMIHEALGNSKLAQQAFTQALTINPHFSLLHAPKAKQALTQLAEKG